MTVGVIAQYKIVEDDKFKQDLADIIGSLTDPIYI